MGWGWNKFLSLCHSLIGCQHSMRFDYTWLTRAIFQKLISLQRFRDLVRGRFISVSYIYIYKLPSNCNIIIVKHQAVVIKSIDPKTTILNTCEKLVPSRFSSVPDNTGNKHTEPRITFFNGHRIPDCALINNIYIYIYM